MTIIKIEIPADYPLLIKAVGGAFAKYEGEAFAKYEGEEYHGFNSRVKKSVVGVSQEEKSILSEETEAPEKSDTALSATDQSSMTATDTSAGVDESAGVDNSTPSAGHPQKDAAGKFTTDHKGVMHIPAVCGNAEKPFYASGPTKGQWKRRVGVTEENYNVTYANALNQVVTGVGSISPDAAAGSPSHTNDQSAEQAFGDTGQGQVSPNDVFATFTTVCQKGQEHLTAAATKCFTDAGLANPSLIFSRPDLAGQVFASLSKIVMGGA